MSEDVRYLAPGTQVLSARRFIDLDRCYYCDEVVYIDHPASFPMVGTPHVFVCDVCMTQGAPKEKPQRGQSIFNSLLKIANAAKAEHASLHPPSFHPGCQLCVAFASLNTSDVENWIKTHEHGESHGR